MGMYLRITQRQNRDGSTVAYYALAESVWNADAKQPQARVIHSFGRADQVDRAALERLVKSINRVLDGDDGAVAGSHAPNVADIDLERVFELGVVLVARTLWEELGIGPAIRACAERANLTAPHETALFVMAANRLDDPVSKLACAERWLSDVAWLPEAAGLAVDQCYRALDAHNPHRLRRRAIRATASSPRSNSPSTATSTISSSSAWPSARSRWPRASGCAIPRRATTRCSRPAWRRCCPHAPRARRARSSPTWARPTRSAPPKAVADDRPRTRPGRPQDRGGRRRRRARRAVRDGDYPLLERPGTVADLGDRVVSANAYMGVARYPGGAAAGRGRGRDGPGRRPGAVPGAADPRVRLGAGRLGPARARAPSSAICWNARARSPAATSPIPATRTCRTSRASAFRSRRSARTARR